MSWAWPQITWAALVAFGVVYAATHDGEPKTGKHSFGITLCAAGISAFVLYMGGFWAGATP